MTRCASILLALTLHVNPCLAALHVFNIPYFEVNFVVDSSTTSVSSPSHQLDISTKFKSATTSYLYDYVDSIMDEYEDIEQFTVSPLESIYIDVNLHTNSNYDNDDGGMRRRLRSKSENDEVHYHFTAEVYGTITFARTRIASNYVMNQIKAEDLIDNAFGGDNAMNEYLSRIENILEGVVSLDVNSNPTLKSSSKKSEGEVKSDVDTSSPVGTVFVTLVAVSTLFMLFGLSYREYQIRKYGGRRSWDGHSLLGELDHYSDTYDHNDINFTNTNECDSFAPYSNDSIQFIPVPARIDEVTNGRKGGIKSQATDITPRRYVSPSSPFELLYGAAFSHRDKEKVLSAHRGVTRGMKYKKKTKKHHKKAKQLKPLNTITEIEEEEFHNESFFPQLISSISSYISDKIDSITPKNKDGFMIYRDFPEHDGAPCVMLTSTDYGDKSLPQPPRSAFQTQQSPSDNENLFYNSSDSDLQVNDDEKSEADSFLDKLENLVAAKSRQYEERKKMYEELTERKKINLEQRRNEKAMKRKQHLPQQVTDDNGESENGDDLLLLDTSSESFENEIIKQVERDDGISSSSDMILLTDTPSESCEQGSCTMSINNSIESEKIGDKNHSATDEEAPRSNSTESNTADNTLNIEHQILDEQSNEEAKCHLSNPTTSTRDIETIHFDTEVQDIPCIPTPTTLTSPRDVETTHFDSEGSNQKTEIIPNLQSEVIESDSTATDC